MAAGVPRFWEGVRLGLAGFFITKATLSSELIHVEKVGWGGTVTFSSQHLTLQLAKCFSVSSYSCGKPAGQDCHPILQKGETEAHGGTPICSRSYHVRGAVES